MVYAILMRNGVKLFKELGSEHQSMLLNDIKVPKEYFFSGRAMMHESLGNYESAMYDYHNSGNDNMAHKVFMKHIAPLYFTNPEDISHLLQSSQAYNLAFYDILCTFETHSQNIVGW